MPLTPEQTSSLTSFFNRANPSKGAVVLDLDGTALFEDHNRKIYIDGAVERGVSDVTALGIPVILNTLRFPLSVTRTIAREWIRVSNARVPVVLLNGSQIGYIDKTGEDIVFNEVASFPMKADELEHIIQTIDALMANSMRDLILFYYPRDWKKGEVIWTPNASRVAPLRRRYRSASEVYSSSPAELLSKIQEAEPCMINLILDRASDTLQSYQHQDPLTFHTHAKVDKTSGLALFAGKLGVSLIDSLGAGDTDMDRFLSAVGLAVIVGHRELAYTGLRETIRVEGPQVLGELIDAYAKMLAGGVGGNREGSLTSILP